MENLPVSTGDIVVLAILALSALLAFVRGFVREVLSIAGWVGAALVTVYAFPHATPYLREYVGIPLLSDAITAVAIFVVALVVFSILSHFLSKGVRGSAMSTVDRSLGFAFGLVRGAVLVSLGYLMIAYFFPEPAARPAWIQEAKTEPLAARGGAFLRSLVPQGAFDDGLQQVDQARDRIARGAEAVDTLQQVTVPEAPADRDADGALAAPAAPSNEASNEDAPAPEPGYNQPQRDQLDRLIDNAQ